MMMIYQREMKRNVKALMIWSAIFGAYILMLLSVYPQFAADQQAINNMMDAYPEQLKKAFGMDSLHFGNVLGFYGVQIYMMTTLIGSIYAAMLASGIIVKEESEKTIEFLLSKPVTRAQIVLEKLSAVVTNLLIFNACLTVTSLIGFQLAEEHNISMGSFALLAAATFLLHVTIAAMSFLLSAIMRKNRSIVSISLGLVFLFYVMDIMSNVSEGLALLGQISLFHYIDAAAIINNESMHMGYVSIMLIITVLSICATFVYYNRKDIAI
jgi:ABC-2 type transport system permease protein